MIWVISYESEPFEVLPVILELLKYVAVPSAMLAVFFAYYKIGHSVGYNYTFQTNLSHAQGISDVTLTNLKDRSTPIFGLYAMVGDIVVELIRFKSPLVLKSFDSVKVDIPPVSEYLIDTGSFDFTDFDENRLINIPIYFSTIKKVRKCKLLASGVLDPRKIRRGKTLKMATKHTERFRGDVYGPSVVLILTYVIGGKAGHAFVHRGGFINWKFKFNGLKPHMLEAPEAAGRALLATMPFLEALAIRKTMGWFRHFQPGARVVHGVDDVWMHINRQDPINNKEGNDQAQAKERPPFKRSMSLAEGGRGQARRRHLVQRKSIARFLQKSSSIR